MSDAVPMTDAADLPDRTTGPGEPFKYGGFEDRAAEEKKRAFVPYAQDLYIAECTDIKMSKGKAYMSDEEVDQIQVTLNLLQTIEGQAPHNIDGELCEKTFMNIWLNPDAVAYNK